MKSPKGANQPKRRALGRGLSALMESTTMAVEVGEQAGKTPRNQQPGRAYPSPVEDREEATQEGQLLYLSIDRVVPNKEQPRQRFAASEIDSLASSIKQSGVLQPIIVRRNKALPAGTFEIVAGERRFRAAKQAGLMKVPALLRQLSDREALELGIIENVQRSDLNPIETAQAYQRLISDFGATQDEVAKTLGRDRTSVANALRLLKLPPEVQQLMIKGELSAGHGRALLMLSSADEQVALARRIIGEQLSVRTSEGVASGKGAPENNTPRTAQKGRASRSKNPRVLELEARFRSVLGTKVSLELNQEGSGELRISFFSPAELESLLERLGA